MSIPLHGLREYEADRTRLSPNWSARPAEVNALDVLVIHATEDGGNEEGAESWMCDPASKVSAHFHLHRDGSLVRLVGDKRKAWHAGPSDWRLYPTGVRVSDLNRVSLGIEIANRCDGRELYTGAQYDTLAAVVAHYCRQGLSLENVCGHEQIAPHRRSDPGVMFSWTRLRLDVLRLLHPDPDPSIACPVPVAPPIIQRAA